MQSGDGLDLRGYAFELEFAEGAASLADDVAAAARTSATATGAKAAEALQQLNGQIRALDAKLVRFDPVLGASIGVFNAARAGLDTALGEVEAALDTIRQGAELDAPIGGIAENSREGAPGGPFL